MTQRFPLRGAAVTAAALGLSACTGPAPSYHTERADAQEFLSVADSIARQLQYDVDHDGVLSDVELEAFVLDFGREIGGFRPAYHHPSARFVLANDRTGEIMGLGEAADRMREEYHGRF